VLKIVCDGEDADEAVVALVELIESGFGEMEEVPGELPEADRIGSRDEQVR